MAEFKELDDLLIKLHQRELVGWEDELKLGKPLYDGLVTLLRAKQYSDQVVKGFLTPHQASNALVVIHRLRSHGSDEEVFSLVEDALTHSSVRVRDQALKLYIAIMREHRWMAPYYTETTLQRLKQCVTHGVYKDAELLAKDLLEQGPSACELR